MNNANIWASTDKWSFTPEGGMIYIENTSTSNVLAVSGHDVIPEVKEKKKVGQLWSKREENAEGYFTLEKFSGTKFLTATSMISLKTKGQYNGRNFFIKVLFKMCYFLITGHNEGKTGFIHAFLLNNEEVLEELLYNFDNLQMLKNDFVQACSGGWIQIVEFLLGHSSATDLVQASETLGETGFMKTCSVGHLPIVKLLLKNSLCEEIIAQRDLSGKTGLTHAILNNNDTIINELLSLPMNLENMLSLSFMNACKENYSKVVRTIMSHPDFDQIVKRKDENGENGFIQACHGKWNQTMDLLLSKNLVTKEEIDLAVKKNKLNGFSLVCQNGWFRTLQLLLTNKNSPIQDNSFNNHQLWKLDGKTLTNKANFWQSKHKWTLKIEGPFIYIENNSEGNRVLGIKGEDEAKVSLLQHNKSEGSQKWIQGKPDNEGYFFLTTSSTQSTKRVLTAIASDQLGISGM